MPRKTFVLLALGLMLGANAFAKDRSLLLQEMSWVDVKEYLKKSDMVIIPLGSTEQHGPHLPLGTDTYRATGMAGRISARTGVAVAPILQVGYCEYHTGFPGTISISPDAMEQVLFEAVQSLIKHGFRRFLFLNQHGGNDIIQDRLLHKINHTTEAVAVSIGHGSPIQKWEGEFFDWHAGYRETSVMLHLAPHLVRMDRAKKPEITFSPRAKRFMDHFEKKPHLKHVWGQLLGVPAATGKGGASNEISSNGVWSFQDPRTANREHGKKIVDKEVEAAVRFINDWKSI